MENTKNPVAFDLGPRNGAGRFLPGARPVPGYYFTINKEESP